MGKRTVDRLIRSNSQNRFRGVFYFGECDSRVDEVLVHFFAHDGGFDEPVMHAFINDTDLTYAPTTLLSHM